MKTQQELCILFQKMSIVVFRVSAGGCLDQLLHDFGAFSESVVCRYVRQVIHGIVFLHENGIIHRDLKGEEEGREGRRERYY